MASLKSDRILQKLGVVAGLDRGDEIVHCGPIYELRREPGVYVQLIFHRDEERRICVGYARHEAPDWQTVESEPYSLRGLGYYERRLKRIANYAGHELPRPGEEPASVSPRRARRTRRG